jgi:hypothetical protein
MNICSNQGFFPYARPNAKHLNNLGKMFLEQQARNCFFGEGALQIFWGFTCI